MPAPDEDEHDKEPDGDEAEEVGSSVSAKASSECTSRGGKRKGNKFDEAVLDFLRKPRQSEVLAKQV